MPGGPKYDLTVFPDHEAFVHGTAEVIVALVDAAVAATGRCTLAVAGGSTPRPVYERLASPACAGRIPWDRVHIFFGDERCVPPDDERSNYRMVREALLDRVPVPASQVHRIVGEEPPHAAAADYERTLRGCFPGSAPPAFDLICLGLGDDGHTASLFPGGDGLRESERWAVPQPAVAGIRRVTLTPPVLNAAREVIFLVEGAGKARVVQEVLTGPHEPDRLPAQIVAPARGRVRWLVDAAAGARLGPARDS